jgi:hypothetical protein
MGWWSFDDSKTQGYIDWAMKKNAQYGIDQQLFSTWSDLFNYRGQTDPNDDNRELAAAEHYAYARWQVATGKTSEEVMRLLTFGYDPIKILGYIPAVWVGRKVFGWSFSRPSTDSFRWGMRGCTDGANDYHRITPDPDAN